ncbi:DNA/RNA non-specific endonuclease [Streptomyces sp. JL7001]|uniref:DNA/RNA non-specific endonuclease n=1 Tax=Streptomyces sp. JL7001 TaxID=3445784 RepID=UPI003F7B1FD3
MLGRLEHRRHLPQEAASQGHQVRQGPRLPDEAQIGNELYEDNPLDRGHLARRADLLWGAPLEAKKANKDSFHYTNITPQDGGLQPVQQARRVGAAPRRPLRRGRGRQPQGQRLRRSRLPRGRPPPPGCSDPPGILERPRLRRAGTAQSQGLPAHPEPQPARSPRTRRVPI